MAKQPLWNVAMQTTIGGYDSPVSIHVIAETREAAIRIAEALVRQAGRQVIERTVVATDLGYVFSDPA